MATQVTILFPPVSVGSSTVPTWGKLRTPVSVGGWLGDYCPVRISFQTVNRLLPIDITGVFVCSSVLVFPEPPTSL